MAIRRCFPLGFTLLYRLPMPDNAVTRLKGSWLRGLTRTQKQADEKVRQENLTCVITDKVAPCRGKAGIRSKLQRFVVFVSKQTRNLISPFDKPIAHRYYAPRSHDSSVVQSVERRTVNPYVTGSSPVRGAKFLFSGVLISPYSIRFQ